MANPTREQINERFEALRKLIENNVKAEYPGKKVTVKATGKQRSFTEQQELKQKGFTEVDVSLHQFEAARDFNIYVNDVLITNEEHKKFIVRAAKKAGMFTLKGDLADSDPFHVSLVKEGKNTFPTLFDKFPSLLETDNAQMIKSLGPAIAQIPYLENFQFLENLEYTPEKTEDKKPSNKYEDQITAEKTKKGKEIIVEKTKKGKEIIAHTIELYNKNIEATQKGIKYLESKPKKDLKTLAEKQDRLNALTKKRDEIEQHKSKYIEDYINGKISPQRSIAQSPRSALFTGGQGGFLYNPEYAKQQTETENISPLNKLGTNYNNLVEAINLYNANQPKTEPETEPPAVVDENKIFSDEEKTEETEQQKIKEEYNRKIGEAGMNADPGTYEKVTDEDIYGKKQSFGDKTKDFLRRNAISLSQLSMSYKDTNKQLPKWDIPQEYMNYLAESRGYMNAVEMKAEKPLSEAETTMLQRQIDTPYTTALGQMGKEGLSPYQVLTGQANIASTWADKRLQGESMKEELKRQYFANIGPAIAGYGDAATQYSNLDRMKFQDKYQEDVMTKQAASELMGSAINNIQEQEFMNRTYGSGSTYDALNKLYNLDVKESIDTQRASKAAAISKAEKTRADIEEADKWYNEQSENPETITPSEQSIFTTSIPSYLSRPLFSQDNTTEVANTQDQLPRISFSDPQLTTPPTEIEKINRLWITNLKRSGLSNNQTLNPDTTIINLENNEEWTIQELLDSDPDWTKEDILKLIEDKKFSIK